MGKKYEQFYAENFCLSKPVSYLVFVRSKGSGKTVQYIGLNKHFFQRKIVNIFLRIICSICFGCSKEPSH